MLPHQPHECEARWSLRRFTWLQCAEKFGAIKYYLISIVFFTLRRRAAVRDRAVDAAADDSNTVFPATGER